MVETDDCDGVVDMAVATLAWDVTRQNARVVVVPAVVTSVDVDGNRAVLELGKDVLADRRRLPLVPPFFHRAPSR